MEWMVLRVTKKKKIEKTTWLTEKEICLRGLRLCVLVLIHSD